MLNNDHEYIFSVYKNTGEYVKTIESTDLSTIFINFDPETEIIVEGKFDHLTYYDNGKVCQCNDKPVPDAVFDPKQKLWVDPRTEEEINSELRLAVVSERNRILASTDWTQFPDSPLSPEKRAEWSVYRQALRDITEQTDFSNIIWPVRPE